MRRGLTGAVVSVLWIAGASLRAAEPAPDLAGRWILNAAKSEDLRAKMREAREKEGGGWGGPGPARGRRGGFGGRGGGPGGGGPRTGGLDGAGRRPPEMSALGDAPAELVVTVKDDEITLLEPDGRLRILRPDGRKHKTGNGEIEVTTRWDDGNLVVESKGGFGPKVTETYKRTGAAALQVDVRVEGGRFPGVSARRVYEPPTENTGAGVMSAPEPATTEP